jgi:hypothetical protein
MFLLKKCFRLEEIMDPTTILVQNLIDAFHQLNYFLGLGLIASVSVLSLEFSSRSSGESEQINISGGFAPMSKIKLGQFLLGYFQ